MNNNICKPISLNCFKHHSGFIAEQLHSIKNPGDFEKLLKSLVLTGNAQMDLYTGTITPHEISKYIIDFLESKKILNSKKYIDWLATKKNNYFIVGLPDQSKWVLLKGKEKEN